MVRALVAAVWFAVLPARAQDDPVASAVTAGLAGPSALVHAPEGVLPAGVPTVLELVVEEPGGAPWPSVPVVTAAVGQVGPLTPEGPGRWRFTWSGPVGAPIFDVRLADVSLRVEGPAFTDGAPALALEPVEDAFVGERVRFRFVSDAPPRAEDLSVRSSEGRVAGVRVVGSTVEVEVEPGTERVARVLAVAVADARAPLARPVWAVARLKARPQLSLAAEAGSSATLRVGKRTYGPFVADASGAITVALEVLPGESSYELSVRDDVGNTQRSQAPLATLGRPVVVGVEAPGGEAPMPAAWLAAFTPMGQPWSSSEPTCRATAPVSVRAHAPGVWRVEAPSAGRLAGLDLRVDCAVSGASATLVVPPVPSRAARLDLRTYPDALSADFPLAQAQVLLLTADGARVAPDGVTVSAARGTVDVQRRGDAVNVEYRGTDAVRAAGADTVYASYVVPAGNGPPWRVQLHVARVGASGDRAQVRVRVFARDGGPLADAPVRVEAYGSDGGRVFERDIRTDGRGWASLDTEVEPRLLRFVASAGAVRASRALPTLPVEGADAGLPDVDAADLHASVELPVRAGRARALALDVSPQPLASGPGARASVTARLRDAAGAAVTDEPVTLTVDAGSVSAPMLQPDGSWRADYVPAPGALAGRVRVSAASGSVSASTELRLEPRPVHGTAGIGIGWLGNLEDRSSPVVTAVFTSRLPLLPEVLSARVSVSGHVARAEVEDPLAARTVDVAATLVPIEAGVVLAQRAGRRSLEAGVGALVTPYRLSVDFGGAGYSGVAVGPLGMALHGGAAWRLGATELFGELRWMLIPPGDAAVSFRGPMGGATAVAGYRVVW